ncbi:MAG: DUF2723 domain-containing protein [Kiritimatiellae bacterium]|nr:DUF2723 domain-containing protein [Kiritimatiellia bacterium]
MIKKLFSTEPSRNAFFRPIDWNAFWSATIISFLVYFFTLGPSVTLEDSGELAVAGDHLGVPHPPGYPIWTICAYLFSRIFSWVTFRGQPTPAWSISLLSAVFAALAAGVTAMLISRSASDMLHQTQNDDSVAGDASSTSHYPLLCWAGGVGGSLIFAFSPVMWSQATIVEVYTLNAFFLMWIFLLTYRWMRQPSDKILWLTAFVFGLGLTNYQVLLLAALPLAVVIFLRNVSLFRDFIMVGVPVALTAHVLQIGAEIPAQPGMRGPAYAKLAPINSCSTPQPAVLAIGAVLVLLSIAFLLAMSRLRDGKKCPAWLSPLQALRGQTQAIALSTGLLGTILMFLSIVVGTARTFVDTEAPLIQPTVYLGITAVVAAIIVVCAVGAYSATGRWNDRTAIPWLSAAGGLMLVLFIMLGAVKSAKLPYGYTGLPFDWSLPSLVLVGGLAVLVMLAWSIPRGLFYALPVVAVQLAAFVLLRKGAMNGLVHPTTWWFWWPAAWNFAVMALAWLVLPNGRNVALTMLFSELGVSFYVYMPIVSDLRNPPMNWGYPRTWEGFKHAITRGQYEKISPADIFDSKFKFQLASYFTDLRVQFTLINATLGLLPFTLWSAKGGPKQRFRALYVASAIYLAVSALVIVSEIQHGEPLWRLDKYLIASIGVLLLVGAGAIALKQVIAFVNTTRENHSYSESMTVGVSLAGIAAVSCLFLTKGFVHYFCAMAAKRINAVTGQNLATIDPTLMIKLGSLGLSLLLIAGLCFGAWWVYRKAEERLDFKVDMDTVSQQWIIATAAGFMVMSVLLVALANIKGDLQDAFIQKVKFISSHGLFALWIGYGLVFGLLVACRAVEWCIANGKLSAALRKPIRVLLLAAALCAALIPVYENYNNEWLVFSMSGAEQNRHDFGWQFGNYQLRGAAAITEELDADEEPLPNPLYPPAMTTNAIFFGGTDPGRFVPTYMIYSAKVRPDVFLITQNALADNTYMSTMRDLYGDDIWIPSVDDSADAFKIYVDDVNSGKRRKNGEMSIEGGRVQVSGALSVMEINGILCDMIFNKNKARHDFYVEESYVINWMFAYLTPNGLIMKINRERSPITQDNSDYDMDFWDWYMRRLLSNPMFRRDLPAQKSFSKLRSAIAGLYAARGMNLLAERAFREACAIYPVSPEANFRLVQEVYMPQNRNSEALDVLDTYNSIDVNNEKGKEFANVLRDIQDTQFRLANLLRLEASGERAMTAQELYDIASCYQHLGQIEPAVKYMLQVAGRSDLAPAAKFDVAIRLSALKRNGEAAKILNECLPSIMATLPPKHLLEAVRIYGEAQDPDRMYAPLNRYLQLVPNDWQAWLNMSTLTAMRQQNAQTQYAIQKALEHGGAAAINAIQGNQVLRQIAAPILQQLRQSGGLDGAGGLNNVFGPRR